MVLTRLVIVSLLSQAAAASAIAIIGACVLRETQPFRRPSDNETAVISQYCLFSWCFSVVLRDMNIADPGVLITLGVLLILATIGVFAHALWRARMENNALHSRRASNLLNSIGTLEDDEETYALPSVETDGHEAALALESTPKPGRVSPAIDHGMIELADLSEQHRIVPPSNSPWELLGLCAASPEPDGRGGTDDDSAASGEGKQMTVLLAKLAEKGVRLNGQTQALVDKDAEIARLQQRWQGTAGNSKSFL
jgi:hypothetical protein